MHHSTIPKKGKIQPDGVSSSAAFLDGATGRRQSVSAPVGYSPVSPSLRSERLTEDAVCPPRGQFLVVKFGGSSVGSAQRLASVCDQVQEMLRRPASPKNLAVVVSAQGNTTDWLLDAAEYASEGNLAAAEHLVDKIAETAITNAFSANAFHMTQVRPSATNAASLPPDTSADEPLTTRSA
jgi:hypothetical protein